MSRNIEVKARLTQEHFERIRQRAAELAQGPARILEQTDTFFFSPAGRLKLRQFADDTAELIFYERPDQSGPKLSSYVRSPIPDATSLLAALRGAYGVRAVVKKRRELFLVERTRIHLDDVDGLGAFLELEVVLDPDQSAGDGVQIASQLLDDFQVHEHQLLDCAYVDLLEQCEYPEKERERREGVPGISR